MPAQLMRPEVLLLIVFVLWGIAGKLDEPLEGFDPEPVQAEAAATEGDPAAQSLHLLCVVEEAGPGSVRRPPRPSSRRTRRPHMGRQAATPQQAAV